MPFSYQHAVFLYEFNYLIEAVQYICDDLFTMRLCLEAGEMPYFPPPNFFNPMDTIVPEEASDLCFPPIPPPNNSLSSHFSISSSYPESSFHSKFDPMQTFGKYE